MTGFSPAAMVLAAGRGERMLPLTRARAKPSLPLVGTSLLGRALAALYSAGVTRVGVNAYHGVDSVRDCLERETRPGLEVRLFEESELQGTGGALVAPRRFLSEQPLFLLQNSDTLLAAPFAELTARCLAEPRCLGALLVRQPALTGYRPLRVEGGLVTGLTATRDDPGAATYLGAGAFRRELLEGLSEAGPRDLFPDLVAPLLERDWKLAAVPWTGGWLEFTDPESYLSQVLQLVGESGQIELPGARPAPVEHGGARLVAAGGASIDPAARLAGRVVAERGSRVSGRAAVRDCLLLESSRVDSARLERVIVADGCRVPDDADWRGGVVSPSDSEAIFTPFSRLGRRVPA